MAFATVRDEIDRLPTFLEHHRRMGVSHFLVVDNNSCDGSLEYLLEQNDVSIWSSGHSYKASRFGIDWMTWLLFRYGAGHWCLTLDADELFLPPSDKEKPLVEMTRWLEANGHEAVRALMIDLYPKGPINQQKIDRDNLLSSINWFDPKGYVSIKRPEMKSEIVRGGPRLRMFFKEDTAMAPTMNKVPLVKWHRRFAYLTSTHVILPPRLNQDAPGAVSPPTAILLHTKFLPVQVRKAADASYRQEHFANSELYQGYYQALRNAPDLWFDGSVQFRDWKQMVDLKLMRTGSWTQD